MARKRPSKNLTEELLGELTEAYDDGLWPKACSEVFMHVCEK